MGRIHIETFSIIQCWGRTRFPFYCYIHSLATSLYTTGASSINLFVPTWENFRVFELRISTSDIFGALPLLLGEGPFYNLIVNVGPDMKLVSYSRSMVGTGFPVFSKLFCV